MGSERGLRGCPVEWPAPGCPVVCTSSFIIKKQVSNRHMKGHKDQMKKNEKEKTQGPNENRGGIKLKNNCRSKNMRSRHSHLNKENVKKKKEEGKEKWIYRGKIATRGARGGVNTTGARRQDNTIHTLQYINTICFLWSQKRTHKTRQNKVHTLQYIKCNKRP